MSEINNGHNGWGQWSRFVLAEIKRAHKEIEKLEDKVAEQNVQIAMLKVKAGIWGAIAGLIPVSVGLVYVILKYAL